MKAKTVSVMAILLVVLGLVVSTGGKRTDVMLRDYTVSEDGSVLTIKVAVASSMGYVRKLKVKQGGYNLVLKKDSETKEWQGVS